MLPAEFFGQECSALLLAHFSDIKSTIPLPLMLLHRWEIFISEYGYTSVRYQGHYYGLAEVFWDIFRIRGENILITAETDNPLSQQ